MLRKIVASSCLAALCIILFAGLHPFTAHPKNDVSWLANAGGVRFGRNGVILSSAPLSQASFRGDAVSLELWLRSGNTDDSSTVLEFYAPRRPVQISLREAGDVLNIEHWSQDARGAAQISHVYYDHVLIKDRDVFLAITSDGHAVKLYVDGTLSEQSRRFGLTPADLSGQLIVGGAPFQDDSWIGDFRGLALYSKELTADEVLQHYRAWVANQPPPSAAQEAAVAVYRFNEGTGTVVNNAVVGAPNLTIPESFKVVDQELLEPPWDEFQASWGYAQDVAINVVGFIPLSFCFCAYFFLLRLRRPALLAACLGAAISLMIEVTQAHIPTRNSDMTDFITNTCGSVLGAMLCMLTIRELLPRVHRLVGAENVDGYTSNALHERSIFVRPMLALWREICSQFLPVHQPRASRPHTE